MKKLLTALIAAGICVSFASALGSQEKGANRYGELDSMYVDKNGDMIADTPEDSAQWEDPDTLIFAYAPVEDPAVYEEVFVDFQRYLAQKTGKKVKWFAVTNYATQIEAMRAGRLHVSGFAAGTVQDAVNTGGFVPLAVMGTANGFVGYRMAIITYNGSGINKIDDLKGKNVAFVSESSNSGYSAPRAILYQNFKLLPNKDYLVSFSGKHDNSITGVYNHDYDAGAIADTVMQRMIAGNRVPDIKTWGKIVYQSEIFPPTAWGVSYRLKPSLRDAVRDAFLSYNWEGSKLKETWPEDDRFIAVDYVKDFKILRDIREGSQKVAELLGE